MWVQIFCLINCAPLHAPPIKFGQLASFIKWDNSDFNTHVNVSVTLKSFSFFFLPQLLFLLCSGFWFLFFLFSMWFVSCRSFWDWFGLFPYFLSVSGFWFLFFLFSMWFESTRTLLSFVSCRSFCFWFGLFPLLSHYIPFSQTVSG